MQYSLSQKSFGNVSVCLVTYNISLRVSFIYYNCQTSNIFSCIHGDLFEYDPYRGAVFFYFPFIPDGEYKLDSLKMTLFLTIPFEKNAFSVYVLRKITVLYSFSWEKNIQYIYILPIEM